MLEQYYAFLYWPVASQAFPTGGGGGKAQKGDFENSCIKKAFLHIKCNSRYQRSSDTQFGQEMGLVMQTTHAQRWQLPDRVE